MDNGAPVRAPRGASGGGPAYTIYCIIAHSQALTVYTSVEWHYYIWYFEFGYRHYASGGSQKFESQLWFLEDKTREGEYDVFCCNLARASVLCAWPTFYRVISQR